MVVPRMNTNFPGRSLRVYLVICVAFFVAMISAVLIFGKEKKKAEAATATPAASTTPAAATGNATAGKAVFTAQGCGACHTFAPAGSTGTVGPNLGKLAESATAANQPLAAFARESIVDPDAYIAAGFTKGIMPPNFGTSLKKTQIDDLVAFITHGK